MTPRRSLSMNSWLQLILVVIIIICTNVLASKHFWRLDVTEDKVHSLDMSTRALIWKLDKPLHVKVYFTEGLQAPYNNHRAALVDKLEELRAYSQGWMTIDVLDPTNLKELEAEAKRFGIEPIDYRFRDQNTTELRKVFMGAALVYADKQEVLPIVTQIETLEYDIARALRALLSPKQSKPVIGFVTGHREPNLLQAGGPLSTLRERLLESYELVEVPLGGVEGVPSNVDVLWEIGPQEPLSPRALYQLDQFLLRGGSLGIFITNSKADMRSLKPQNLFHGMEPLLGHYGVQVNRDLLVDRVNNGRMTFPIRYGETVRPVQLNYPLIPKLTIVNGNAPAVKGIDSMLAPFASSVVISEQLSSKVKAETWVSTSLRSGSLRGVTTLDPKAFQMVAPGEETGSKSVIVGLTGVWDSYFAKNEIPNPDTGEAKGAYEESERLREGTTARLMVAGSADMVANNIAFMLNLADWMVQDEALINIRSKVLRVNTFEPLESAQLLQYRLFNLFGGSLLLFCGIGLRWFLRHRKRGSV